MSEIKTEIKSAEFRLSKQFMYTASPDNPQRASVKLTIDYLDKTFSVIPDNGLKDFEFRVGSHKSEMWKAVADLIYEAIEFGEKEVTKLETTKADPF